MEPGLIARIREQTAAIVPAVTELRHDLHRHPETAFHEERTGRVIAERLRALGLEVRTDLAATGVVALVRGGRPGKTVALRADIDALPVAEASDLPYRSLAAGRMHACGHDGHTAILLGVAEVLAAMRAELAGSVKLIFQPAEESVAGARAFREAGVLRDPRVEAIVALHGWPGVPLGSIEVFSGPVMASADTFDLTITGRGGHGAMPHLAVDAVVVAAEVVSALQNIASREVSPASAVVVSVTSLQAGETYNVIPEVARLKGTVRTLSPLVRAKLAERVRRIAGGIARAYGATAELDYRTGCPITENHADICRAIRQAAEPMLGAESIRADGRPSMGAEDFSYYLEQIPGALFRLGLGEVPSLHNPRFDFPDAALPIGVELMAGIALSLLGDA